MTGQVSMDSVVAQGDEAAQRQHLGNLIFGPISAINQAMAPRIVGLIVYTLSISQILSIVNDEKSRHKAVTEALQQIS